MLIEALSDSQQEAGFQVALIKPLLVPDGNVILLFILRLSPVRTFLFATLRRTFLSAAFHRKFFFAIIHRVVGLAVCNVLLLSNFLADVAHQGVVSWVYVE